jgi:tetratricopeptide (TPR) repeat protein
MSPQPFGFSAMARNPRVRMALLACVVAVLPASESVGYAQNVTRAAVEARTAQWQNAVLLHTRGQFDDAAATVARWPPDVTRIVVKQFIDHSRERLDERRAKMLERDRAELRRTLARGLLLHTDIAITERTTHVDTATGARTLRVLDGRRVDAQRFSIHWGLGRQLADALAPDAGTAPIALSWYRAVGALFQQWADLGQLFAHLSAASDTLPDDPVLLLYRGSLHQAYADARVQAYLEPLRAPGAFTINRTGLVLSIEEPSVELGTAERFLRRALALDQSLAEAHIRLAHVLDTRGRAEEALPHARQAVSSPLPEYLGYYGHMVLGRIASRLGDRGEARAAFERAMGKYPRSQAAQVALSRVALSDGRGLNAADALVAALGPTEDAAEDPWTQYLRVHEPGAAERLNELRRMVP